METCQVLAGNVSIGELSYKVPNILQTEIKVGQTVIVPLGNRLVEGIVTGFEPAPEGLELKEIISISSKAPVFDEAGLDASLVADAMSFAPSGTHLSKNLWKPPALKVERKLVETGSLAQLKPSESALLETIRQLGDEATLGSLNKRIGKGKVTYALRGLIDKGVVKIEDSILSSKSRIKQHFEVIGDDELGLKEIAPKHDTVSGLARDTGVSPTKINKLIKLGKLAKVEDKRPSAPPKLDQPGFSTQHLEGLNPSQRIDFYFKTGSELLSQGRSMIIVAPTNFACESIFEALSGKIPCQLCTGGMSDSQTHDLKDTLEAGANAVVIGLAGSLFLPLPNLSAIAIDEPLSPMFETDVPFELRLTNLAKIRAERSNCKLIYCGAPFSLEGAIAGVTTEGLKTKPEIINMVFEIGSGEQTLVSEGLVKSVNGEIKDGRPSIIILNRKGFSNFVFCDDCGEVLKCPRCQIPLTYYSSDNSVSCRFCGYKGSAPETCPSCQSIFIRFKAGGTERLRLELSKRLNAGRLLFAEGGERDSAKNLKTFGKPGDVLVSTNMMLDRADLTNVRLIALASLDGLLSMPVFSATQKAYSLTSILASRLPENGRLLIQTYMTHHPFFGHLKENTISKLLLEELEDRKEANYPPYTQILWWHVVGKDQAKSAKDAQTTARRLTSILGAESVVGPNAGYFHRLKGEYRWDILLKMRNMPDFLEMLRMTFNDLASSGIRIEVTNPNI